MVELAQMPWQARFGLAAAAIVLLAVSLGLSYVNQDDANRGIIVGAIIAAATNVIGYYFGSSDSSFRKDAALVKRAEQAPP